MRVHRARSIKWLLLLIIGGCAQLKQCAYEGFNRDHWQQPAKVIAALAMRPGDRVADLGSGSGYFTFRLARAVGPNGRVYAVDIDPDMNALVARHAKETGAANVEVITARADDPSLPATGVDLIFAVNTYHHIGDRVAYFARLKPFLRAGGRIAIIDFDDRGWIQTLWSHHTPAEVIKRELAEAGFVLQREFDFLDRQSFIVFAPPPPALEKVPAAPPAASQQFSR